MNKKELLDELLGLTCSDTGEPIQVGEAVALHDWGIRTSTNVIGYGRFKWDAQYRGFKFEKDEDLDYLGKADFYGVEDEYDLFRTSPRKLNKEELDKLKTIHFDMDKLIKSE